MKQIFTKKILTSTSVIPLMYLKIQQQRKIAAEAKSISVNRLETGFCNIPHHKKAYKGGEDAWISSDSLIAVADGVGGWNKKGVDPGIFARELCAHVNRRFNAWLTWKERYEIDLWELLVQSVKETQARGTSTFVMALLDAEDAHLRTLNLGDSGFIILRADSEGKLQSVFRSEEKQHRFNNPYQCGTNHKLPYMADVYLHQVKHNDVLVMGSDGLFDNVFDKDLISCLQTQKLEPTIAATCLAQQANTLSFDKKYDSPFAINARAANRSHPGGKKDDITVVVSQVKLRNFQD